MHVRKYKQLVQRKKRTHIRKCKQELQCLTTENPNNYWGFLKNLKRKSTQEVVDIDLSDFYHCFLKQSIPPQGQIDSSLLENKISSWKEGNPPFNIRQDIANNILNSNNTTCEIIHALKKLKKGKSPGIDGISLEFIKSDMITFLPLLESSFNNILNTGDYADKWVQGTITPIHESGRKSCAENYRRISVMPALGKLFKSILETRLSYKNEVCIDDDPCQAGFKRNSRTIDNIFILQSLVVSQKAYKKTLYACYIDFTKAFDYVNRDALIFKFKKRFVDGKFLSVIKFMFNKSDGRDKWRNTFSKPIKSTYGVPQGGVLSPKLFTGFLCDISEYLDSRVSNKVSTYIY